MSASPSDVNDEPKDESRGPVNSLNVENPRSVN